MQNIFRRALAILACAFLCQLTSAGQECDADFAGPMPFGDWPGARPTVPSEFTEKDL